MEGSGPGFSGNTKTPFIRIYVIYYSFYSLDKKVENGQMMNIACPNCGSSTVHEKLVTEAVPYKEIFLRVTMPILICECGEMWSDSRGEDARTLAMFKHEKTTGICRNKFTTAEEKSLWEQA